MDPVDLAHVLGIERPKVAVLSAIEVVDPAITAAIGGEADILLVPNLEAGNILYKSLTHLARADVAGIVLGTRVPLVLTSRADTVHSRVGSAALATLWSARPGAGSRP